MKKIFLIFLLGTTSLSLSACSTISKASKNAAEFDNDINADARKIDHHMEHYTG